MDLKKFSLTAGSRRKRKKGDTTQLAAQLAPLEEQNTHFAAQQTGSSANSNSGQSGQGFGRIVVDNESLNFPREIAEERGEKPVLGMEPVVIVILIVMLAFIAFIAWQISEMPAL